MKPVDSLMELVGKIVELAEDWWIPACIVVGLIVIYVFYKLTMMALTGQ